MAALLFSLLPAVSISAADLASVVKGLVGTSAPKKGATAVSIRTDDSKEIVRINSDIPMVPASNEKLLTTGSALHVLGVDFVFQTRLLRDGNRLIAVGDGDPSFADPELLARMVHTDLEGRQIVGATPESLLDLWAQGAQASGMVQCDELVIDDRIFDRVDVHFGWPSDQLNEHYCAPVGGIPFHLNRLDVWAKPSDRGAEVLKIRPENGFTTIVNQSKKTKNKDDGIWIQREDAPNTFSLHGECKKTLEEPVSIALSKPSSFFAKLLAERLEKRGIQVRSIRLSGAGDPVSKGDAVGPLIRTPISSALTRCNVDSHNLYAECLLKRMGHASTGTPGTWLNGSDAVEKCVRSRIGGSVNMDALDAVDGSGLSKENRVSAGILSAWLDDLVKDEKLGPVFIASLAVGGESGTVRKRFLDLDEHKFSVHCKTGYINGVSALSGLVRCVNGRYATFSVICNGFEAGGVGKAKQLQESIVKATANYLGSLAPIDAAGSPHGPGATRESMGGG